MIFALLSLWNTDFYTRSLIHDQIFCEVLINGIRWIGAVDTLDSAQA
jgi:hypothetical protein